MAKSVWIVGAGASKSDTDGTYPALNEIPVVAHANGVLLASAAEPGHMVLRDYIQRLLGRDLARGPHIDLEYVLTLLEIDIAVTNAPTLLLARHYLLTLLRDTFADLESRVASSRGEYQRLAATLQSEDSVITFNWDCRLDDHVGRAESIDAEGDVRDYARHYGQLLNRFSGPGDSTIDRAGLRPPMRKWPSDKGLLVKAHGSIDWFQCVNPGCRQQGALFISRRAPDSNKCGWCYEQMEVVIVPPTSNKRLRDTPVIRRLWNAAAEEIQLASELNVWGYSLPATDFFSAWLLRKAGPSSLKSVRIINPDICVRGPKKARLNQAFLHRFFDLVPVRRRDLHIALFLSFADYEAGRTVDQVLPEVAKQVERFIGTA